ncbi:MAG: hypothetical protein MRY72_04285 [Aquisalinus sp.]|nr:hypothetical protein [Aquisalinus sp.]
MDSASIVTHVSIPRREVTKWVVLLLYFSTLYFLVKVFSIDPSAEFEDFTRGFGLLATLPNWSVRILCTLLAFWMGSLATVMMLNLGHDKKIFIADENGLKRESVSPSRFLDTPSANIHWHELQKIEYNQRTRNIVFSGREKFDTVFVPKEDFIRNYIEIAELFKNYCPCMLNELKSIQELAGQKHNHQD